MRERITGPHISRGNIHQAIGGARLALAAVETIAIAANFQAIGITAFDAGNYFCFFTVQSAVGAVVLLVLSGVLAITSRPESSRIHAARSIVLGYVILAGIVYGILAVGSAGEVKPILVTPSDVVLHFIMPVLLVIDFVAERRLAVRTNTLPWLTMGWALPYPGVWLVFTMVRGSVVGWFPYFFIDPTRTKSPVEMGLYITIVCLMILVLTTGSLALTRIGAHELFATIPDAALPAQVPIEPVGAAGTVYGFSPAALRHGHPALAPSTLAALQSQLGALSAEWRWTSSAHTTVPRSTRCGHGHPLGAVSGTTVVVRAPRPMVLHGATLHAGTLHSGTLHSGTLQAGMLPAGHPHSATLHGAAMHAGTLHAGTLQAGAAWAGAAHAGAARRRLRSGWDLASPYGRRRSRTKSSS